MRAVRIRSIDQLLLDAENPRIGSATSQRDALQKVLDEQEVKLFNLAESIADDGLSPIESIMVVREKAGSDRFISVEGNRRVAALKILANPHQLADLNVKESLQKRFESLAQRFDRKLIEPLHCAEATDRMEAQPWIRRRHIGEDEGRGVVDWSSMASRRFAGTDPALQALDFVRKCGGLSQHQLDSLLNFPITTLDRLLSTVEVRQRIGVDIKDRMLRSSLHPDELIKPLRRMVLDLAAKVINVSDLKNKDLQKEYVDAFGANDKPNLSNKGMMRAV